MPTPRPRIAWPLAMYAPGTDRPLCPRCCGLCCAQCEIARVSREALLTVSKDYPQSAAYLRLAGLKLATRRGFVLCSLVARIVSQQADNAKAAADEVAQAEAKRNADRLRSPALSSQGCARSQGLGAAHAQRAGEEAQPQPEPGTVAVEAQPEPERRSAEAEPEIVCLRTATCC